MRLFRLFSNARPVPVILAAVMLLALVLTAATAAKTPATTASPTASTAATGSCNALIRKGNKLVSITQLTYRYRFVKIKSGPNKGRFRRRIVRVRVKVKVSCAKQCAVTVKSKGKYRPVYAVKTVKVKAVKRGRIVTVKRRKKVYRFGACPAGLTTENLGTPVSVSILPGSFALLDFGAFQRQAPVTGVLRGFVPGKIQLNSDIQMTLNRGSLTLGSTAVFIDDLCNGKVSAAIRTGNPTSVTLDPTRTTTATLLKSGTVTSIAYTVVRLPLELRNDDTGCDKPYITTGYREFKQTFFLRGKVGAGGLTKLVLQSPADTLVVEACLAPGVPTQPCNGFAIPLPILVSTKLIASVDLSGKT